MTLTLGDCVFSYIGLASHSILWDTSVSEEVMNSVLLIGECDHLWLAFEKLILAQFICYKSHLYEVEVQCSI